VVADVHQIVQPDEPARLAGAAPGEAPDEGVGVRERTQRVAGVVRHGCLGRALDDRGQRAVDVAEHRGGARSVDERPEKLRKASGVRGGGVHGPSIAAAWRTRWS
jgi:hypothetical protein